MLRYLALGDSYTIGESVKASERWPNQLAKLMQSFPGLKMAPPKIIAKTGWTTAELDQGIDEAKLGDAQFDIVTLLIGVNNQYRGQDFAIYRREYVALLKLAIGFARNDAQHVIGVSIPDYGATPFAKEKKLDPAKIAQELDEYNAFAKKTLTDEGAHWVEITQDSRKQASQSGMLADDELHPSGKMYATWAKKAVPFVRKSLG
ncbi:MAG: SGNH/GDSL hydrolase family protein [Planctomycetota bacterium]|nr:SGNH/GDSL hydrolase family protein [Planctomycetota bacterium]